jgi:hypothetical protein
VKKPPASERLEALHFRLASTEVVMEIGRLKGAAVQLAKSVGDGHELHAGILNFVELCTAKAMRLRPSLKPRPRPQRPPIPVGGTIPQLRTIVSDWHQDPDDPAGVLSRRIYSTDVAETVPPP